MKSEISNLLEITLLFNLFTLLRVKSRYLYILDRSSTLTTRKRKYLSSDRAAIGSYEREILWRLNLYHISLFRFF